MDFIKAQPFFDASEPGKFYFRPYYAFGLLRSDFAHLHAIDVAGAALVNGMVAPQAGKPGTLFSVEYDRFLNRKLIRTSDYGDTWITVDPSIGHAERIVPGSGAVFHVLYNAGRAGAQPFVARATKAGVSPISLTSRALRFPK